MKFREEREIGYCGLACVLCNIEDCPGCTAKIAGGGACPAGGCAAGKGIDGCYACPEYDTCTENMPHGKRNKAFNRYAREFGKQALTDRLRINYENGITYHRADKLSGDYDVLETGEGIYRLLRYGHNDPYEKCPEYETEHFRLRQVRREDAEELLDVFYNDVSQWMFFANGDRRIFPSPRPTLEEVQKLIRFWLEEYRNRVYARLSVIDRSIGKAIGTIELYGNDEAYLHLDLYAPYETREHIAELLALADGALSAAFGVKRIMIQAVPSAAERIAALATAGYRPYDGHPDDVHYYRKEIKDERK